MAEALYRWNGSEWIPVATVNSVVIQGGTGGGLRELGMQMAWDSGAYAIAVEAVTPREVTLTDVTDQIY
jgi:hypothetical protein